jgi:putative FmdB family regulatory protein
MPLYEYQCEACAHRFEVIQKFSDPPIETCPRCGGAVRKLLSSPAIQFKGSGWYITDYAKKDSSASTAASSDSKSEAKTETKTETKTDTTSSKPATS